MELKLGDVVRLKSGGPNIDRRNKSVYEGFFLCMVQRERCTEGTFPQIVLEDADEED